MAFFHCWFHQTYIQSYTQSHALSYFHSLIDVFFCWNRVRNLFALLSNQFYCRHNVNTLKKWFDSINVAISVGIFCYIRPVFPQIYYHPCFFWNGTREKRSIKTFIWKQKKKQKNSYSLIKLEKVWFVFCLENEFLAEKAATTNKGTINIKIKALSSLALINILQKDDTAQNNDASLFPTIMEGITNPTS